MEKANSSDWWGIDTTIPSLIKRTRLRFKTYVAQFQEMFGIPSLFMRIWDFEQRRTLEMLNPSLLDGAAVFHPYRNTGTLFFLSLAFDTIRA